MTILRVLTAAAAASLFAAAAAAQTPAAQPAAPPAAPAATPAAPAAAPVPLAKPLVANGDIMTTLRTSGQFNTFVKALDATNLAGLLQKQPNITVFAPSDAAFAAAYPAGALDQMLASDAGKQQVQKLLIYHLINAKIDTTKFKGARGPFPAGSGDKIVLDGSEAAQLKAENANIVQADVACSNGLIQVVDQVMKPGSVPEANPQPAPEPEAAPAPAPEPEKPAAKPARKKK